MEVEPPFIRRTPNYEEVEHPEPLKPRVWPEVSKLLEQAFSRVESEVKQIPDNCARRMFFTSEGLFGAQKYDEDVLLKRGAEGLGRFYLQYMQPIIVRLREEGCHGLDIQMAIAHYFTRNMADYAARTVMSSWIELDSPY